VLLGNVPSDFIVKILLYIFSTLSILAGLSLFTKSRNKTTAKMGSFEHISISITLLLGGFLSILSSRWSPAFLAIIIVWIIYGICEKKRINSHK